MPAYNEKLVHKSLIEQIVERIKSAEADNSFKAHISWISENEQDGNYLSEGTTAVDLIFDDLELDVAGFEPNRASYLIELWYKDVTMKDGKVDSWNGEYSTCWDERDDIWKWYIQQEGEVKILEDFDNTTGFGSGFIDFDAPIDPKKFAGGRLGVDCPLGGRALARIVHKGIMEQVTEQEIDTLLAQALKRVPVYISTKD